MRIKCAVNSTTDLSILKQVLNYKWLIFNKNKTVELNLEKVLSEDLSPHPHTEFYFHIIV